MKHKYKKSNLVISIILFVISAFFLGYGIYMIDYSIDYVRTYKEISSIALDNATQYVISSSYTYIGFAVLIFIGGFLIFSLRKTSCKIQPDNMIITNETDEDLHPENNPYFIASTESIPNEMKEIETTPDEIHSSNLFQKSDTPEPSSPESTISETDTLHPEDHILSDSDENDTKKPLHNEKSESRDTEATHWDNDNVHAKIMSDSWLKDIFEDK